MCTKIILIFVHFFSEEKGMRYDKYIRAEEMVCFRSSSGVGQGPSDIGKTIYFKREKDFPVKTITWR